MLCVGSTYSRSVFWASLISFHACFFISVPLYPVAQWFMLLSVDQGTWRKKHTAVLKRAYCEISADIGVRMIKKREWQLLLFCVPEVAFIGATRSQHWVGEGVHPVVFPLRSQILYKFWIFREYLECSLPFLPLLSVLKHKFENTTTEWPRLKYLYLADIIY